MYWLYSVHPLPPHVHPLFSVSGHCAAYETQAMAYGFWVQVSVSAHPPQVICPFDHSPHSPQQTVIAVPEQASTVGIGHLMM